MKNVLKLTGLITLICFSFFYTEQVIQVVNEQDPIMIKLNEIKEQYQIESTDAQIINNTIIPGLNGRKINIKESYQNMKQLGMFKEELISYDEILPNLSLKDNKDKYITRANSNKNAVSLIFIIKDNTNLDELIKLATKKNIKLNFFVDYTFLNQNITKLKKLSNIELYSYGNNGTYTKDNLIYSNNIIERISNQATYCLSTTQNDETLNTCKNNDMYTIVPSLITTTNTYSEITNNLASGSIILLEPSKKNLTELNTIAKFIESKGLKIQNLSSLLTESINQ